MGEVARHREHSLLLTEGMISARQFHMVTVLLLQASRMTRLTSLSKDMRKLTCQIPQKFGSDISPKFGEFPAECMFFYSGGEVHSESCLCREVLIVFRSLPY